MKPCSGCKHLLIHRGESLCLHVFTVTPRDERVTNEYTGKTEYRRDPSRPWRAPRVADVRSPEGACGPDRALYKPGLIARLLPFLYD
jgi:hypothetical protein